MANKNIIKEHPTVSISYTWDSEQHKEWVRKLADDLRKNGINVILDQYDLTVGKNMIMFMETAIECADKVLIILSPEYKLKSASRNDGAGFEYSLISTELFEIQNNNEKFIPVLRVGSRNESISGLIKSLVYHDMRNDVTYLSDLFKLLRIIYDEPEITKPSIGSKPDFNKIQDIDPIILIANDIKNKEDLETAKKEYLRSSNSWNQVRQELSKAFFNIQEKANQYKEKTKLFFRADCNEQRLILYSEGLCLNFYFANSVYGIANSEIHLTIWDKPLSLKNDRFDPPYDQPKELWSLILKPFVSDDVLVLWKNGTKIFRMDELNGFCFSTLLEYVQKDKTKKHKNVS